MHNPHKTKQNGDTKKDEESKRYKVVFQKRVVDPDTFKSYPYGYTRTEFDDVNMKNIDILVGL